MKTLVQNLVIKSILIQFILLFCNVDTSRAMQSEKIFEFNNINAQDIQKYDDNLIFLKSFNKIFVSKDKMKTWEIFYEAKDLIGKKANIEYYLRFSMMEIGNDFPRVIIEMYQLNYLDYQKPKRSKIFSDDMGLTWKDFYDLVFINEDGEKQAFIEFFYTHNENFSIKKNYINGESNNKNYFYLIDSLNKNKDTMFLKTCTYNNEKINNSLIVSYNNEYIFTLNNNPISRYKIYNSKIGDTEFKVNGIEQPTIFGLSINKYSNRLIYLEYNNYCIKISDDFGNTLDTVIYLQRTPYYTRLSIFRNKIHTLDFDNYIVEVEKIPFLINTKNKTTQILPTYMSYINDIIKIDDKWFVTSPIGLLYSNGDFTKWEIYKTNLSSQEIVQTKYVDGFWHKISKLPNEHSYFEFYSFDSKNNFKYNNRFRHWINGDSLYDKGSIIRTNNNTLIASNMFDYFVSSDNGSTWDSVPENNKKHSYKTKKFKQFDNETIYCFVNGDFLASRDEGRSWNYEQGNIYYNFLDICPAKGGDTLYATTNGIKKGDSTGYFVKFLNLENTIDNIQYVKNKDLVFTHYLDSITGKYKIHRYYNYGENEKITEINLEQILYIDTLINEEIISYTSDNWGNIYLLSPYNIYILNHNSDKIEIIKPSEGERFTYIDFDYIDDNQADKQIYYTTNTGIYKLSNPTSVENDIESESKKFIITPNPVNNEISLTLSNQIYNLNITEIQILDALGNIILDKIEIFQNIDISSLTNGTYFLQIKYFDTNNKTEMLKFIKQ